MAKQYKREQVITNPFTEVNSGLNETAKLLAAVQNNVDALNASLKNVSTQAGAIKSAMGGDVKGNSLDEINKINKAHAESIKLLKEEKALKTQLGQSEQQLQNLYEKFEAERAKNEAKRQADHAKREVQYNKEIAAQEKLNNVYSKAQIKLNTLTNEYRNLALRKELGAKLTDKESQRYEFLRQKIDRYDKALKATDASMGKHQRNVGNYASAWNGLGNSVQQLSRELPAFGNSIQTGLMAISNNLPMFFDEIKKVRLENQALAASGQPTVSVFKQIGQSIFSVTGLLSIGVTLLTLYGAKVIDFITGSKKSEEQLKKEAKAKEELNRKRREGSEFIGKESAELTGLLVALRNTNKGSEERAELMDKINKQYGTHLKNLSDEAEFQNMVNETIFEYIAYQREAFRVRKNTELIERNLAKQDMIYKTINKELGLTNKELDKISQKSGGFGILASELQQGVAPIQSIAKELDISERRAKQLVLRYRELQKADSRAVDTNIAREEATFSNLVQDTKELIGLSEELGLVDENRAKTVMRGLFALDAANARLNQYGTNIADATGKMDGWEDKTRKVTASQKEFTLALDDFNDELQRRLDLGEQERKLIQEILQLNQDAQIDTVSRIAEQEFQNQLEFAKDTGEIYVDTLERLLNEEFDLREAAAKERSDFALSELQKSFEAERALAFEELEKQRDELLKQEGLTANGRRAILTDYQRKVEELNIQFLEKERIVALEREKIELELQQQLGNLSRERVDRLNEVNNELIEAQMKYYEDSNKLAESDRKKKEEQDKKELEAKKKQYQEILKLSKKAVDEIFDYEIKDSQRKQKQLDDQINASQQNYDLLKEQAAQGNLAAEASLKEQQKITDKYRDQKQAEEERQAALEQAKKYAEMAINITNNLIQNGENPILAAGKGVGIVQVIKALFGKGFFFGTDDTGKNSPVSDEFGAITGFTHENEQVWSKKDRNDVDYATRQELKDAWKLVNSPQMILGKVPSKQDVAHSPITRELIGEVKSMNKKLDNMPNEFFSTEVIDGVLAAAHNRIIGNTHYKRFNTNA